LRTSTGASIIAIYRDPDQILAPQTDTVILPGDVLLLLGEKGQLDAALHYLTELCKEKEASAAAPPGPATVIVAEDSPVSGSTLAGLGLWDQFGVLVVGVRRGDEQTTNPGPDFRVQAGDTLYLWGPAEKIEEAKRRIGLP
jgi:K+/H+ antiporter YhaU regulatory subunit KhtT